MLDSNTSFNTFTYATKAVSQLQNMNMLSRVGDCGHIITSDMDGVGAYIVKQWQWYQV